MMRRQGTGSGGAASCPGLECWGDAVAEYRERWGNYVPERRLRWRASSEFPRKCRRGAECRGDAAAECRERWGSCVPERRLRWRTSSKFFAEKSTERRSVVFVLDRSFRDSAADTDLR